MISTSEFQVAVLGSGPVGILAALELSKQYKTALITHRLPSHDDRPTVESIPASLLGLLVDYGIHPKRIGVDELHETRLIAWEQENAEKTLGSPAAHIERPALDLALLDALIASQRVKIILTRQPLSRASIAELQHRSLRLIDATGRRSVSATRRIHPAKPWIARSFLISREYCPAGADFRIAPLSWGFVYRLGSARRLLIGVVGSGKAVAESSLAIEQQIQHWGAGWILDDLPSITEMGEGRRAPASVQWTNGDSGLRIGDAALARDTLSSQGLATGLSEALYTGAIRNRNDQDLFALRQCEQRGSHLRSLAKMITTCRFRESDTWREYSEFVEKHLNERYPASAVALQRGQISIS